MKRIGITGQNGFVGGHLFRTISLRKEIYKNICFERSFFDDQKAMDAFVRECDVIIHLAGLNRHENPEVIYETNIELTKKLVSSLIRTKSTAHVIFSSSIQEESNNLYGKSKKECRTILSMWADEYNGKFSGLVIPNVFGPFCRPFYNSLIATFSHELNFDIPSTIKTDQFVQLIYIDDLVMEIIKIIEGQYSKNYEEIPYTNEINVSQLLYLLKRFKDDYIRMGIIPRFNDRFELNLFNTFRSYADIKHKYPGKFVQHTDERGSFVEIIKLNGGGQVSFSTTKPGITRGNHFHTRKIERFAVISGKALIQLRQIGKSEVLEYSLSGNEPSYVDMPIWFTHNIKNIGKTDLYTIFWINEIFNVNDPDTYFEEV